MKSSLFVGASVALTAVMAFAAKDPVVMTINGKDVPRSEFEYLYHKNTQQQIEPQPLSEYVEMFKIYKLKVADALACGIDTTKNFKRDMLQYRRELSAPYMTDSAYVYKLAKEQYDRGAEEVEAKHIMLFKTQDIESNKEARARIDSIHGVLMNGGDFAALAEQYSQDRASNKNGGSMGYLTPGMLPYSFETVMYETPQDAISDVVETAVGYHIIKGGNRRPNSGTVEVSHILLSTQGKTTEQIERQHELADSLVKVLRANPSEFTALAKKYSQDPSVAQNGGALPPFGPGRMVAEFSDASFAMADGEISDPVKTRFGYHIILKHGHQERASFEDSKAKLVQRITNPSDERSELLRDNQWKTWGKQFKLKTDTKVVNELLQGVEANGLVETMSAALEAGRGDTKLFTIGKGVYTISDFADYSKNQFKYNVDPDLVKVFNKSLKQFQVNMLREEYYASLAEKMPDYRNLLNEYRDGSLLYEISLQKVWDKAAKDTEGLAKYFAEHRADFKWSEPRVKGYLIKASSDSIAEEVRKRLPEINNDSIITTIRAEFGKNVQIDKVLVKKGDNAIVDYLVFAPKDGDKPYVAGYPSFFMYNFSTLNEPEEVDDVKGVVISAYQDQLEQDWVKQLKEQYPVVVNEKELRKIK